MKSNVCNIKKDTEHLDAILKESERVAEYNRLTHKQSLQLRLLCEEIDGMLPNIIDGFEGSFWIELEDGVCKVKVSIQIPALSADKREELIGISKNKKNAAAVGIVGKIRSAIEGVFLNHQTVEAINAMSNSMYLSGAYGEGIDYAYLWSLDQYRSTVDQSEASEAWDELEKSVIASVADDVIVGVKGARADITVVKKFA